MASKSEKFLSGGQPIELEVFEPAPAGKHRAVLILHGTFGLIPKYRPDIVSFADALVAKGISATLPHYLDATKSPPGLALFELIPVHLPAWRKACSDALALMAADPRFDASHLGIIGFSLGGHLALSLGMKPPTGTEVQCVVDYFGPTKKLALDNAYSDLAPVLIHHGTEDQVVLPEESDYLVEQLQAAGKKEGEDKDYVFKSYPGEGHGFKSPALEESLEATIKFILKHL